MSNVGGLAWVILFAAGCGANVVVDPAGSSSSGTIAPVGDGSCDSGAGGVHVCTTHSLQTQQSCVESGGTWESACPPGAIGSCTIGAYSNAYYGPGPGFAPTQLQAACTAAGGIWS